MDEDGNYIPGRLIDMVVDGNDVFIVSVNGEYDRLELLPVFSGSCQLNKGVCIGRF